MIEILYYFQKFFSFNKLIYDLYNFLSELFLNYSIKRFYSLFYRFLNNPGIQTKITNNEIIVSLTSFPPRINDLAICIETIMSQKTKPNRIILWLAKSDFENKDNLPNHLRYLEKRGLEIQFCEEDIRSHKKYYYSMQKYPNAVVITLDDDCYYPNYTLRRLIESHYENPEMIICNKCRKVNLLEDSIPPYINWEGVKSKHTSSSLNYVPIGVGGVLYPPNSLSYHIFNINDIKEISLHADDLWLKINSLINKTYIFHTGEYPRLFSIGNTQKTRLSEDNYYNNKNDIIIKNILKKYKNFL